MERKIQSIDAASVARICSGQVIVDLASVVKELVENALDAHATSVEIRLKNHGAELIEVTDNGDGISPDNYEGIAMKYHTSKLERFDDLTSVNTFGFRGEALSSICELSEFFSVTTKTNSQQIGTALEFSKSGAITSQRPVARSTGTTVSVVRLFETLPVRRAEYVRNIKKQFAKMMKLLQAYAIIAVGVRFNCVNMNGTQRQSVLATQVGKRLEDNITCTFGAQFLSSLMPLKVEIDLEHLSQSGGTAAPEEPADGAEQADDLEAAAQDVPAGPTSSTSSSFQNTFAAFSQPTLAELDGNLVTPAAEESKDAATAASTQATQQAHQPQQPVVIEGFVSKVGLSAGRSDSDRQFLYLNGRPVDLPKATRVVNEAWRKQENKAKPSFVLDFKVPAGTFDVNVTPDKREIVLVEESRILERLRAVLEELYNETYHTSSLTQDAPKLSQLSFAPSAAAFLASFTQANVSLSQSAQSTASASSGGGNDILSPPATPSFSHSQPSTSSSPAAVRTSLSPNGARPSPSSPSDLKSPLTPPQPKATSWVSQSEKALLQTAYNAAVARESAKGERDASSPAVERPNSKRPRPSPPRVQQLITDEDDFDVAELEEGDVVAASPARTPVAAASAAASSSSSESARSSKRKATAAASSSSASASYVDIVAEQPAKQQKQAPKPTTSDFSFAPATVLQQFRATFGQGNVEQEDTSKPGVPAECSTKTTSMEEAAAALSKVLTKQDFNEMRIIGQFNLGFVIAELHGDLFILDQHACDEKYNFELFQRTTTLHGQPLIQPLPANASASEEIIIIDNMEVFEQNGFRFHVDDDKPPGSRLYLTAVPFSKHVQFGVKDVHELASIVAQHGVDTTAKGMRLPKVSAMFASRACRQAVMIGTALQRPEMERIVRNMSTMEHPWNCPHGRPTLRHLVDLDSLRQSTKRDGEHLSA